MKRLLAIFLAISGAAAQGVGHCEGITEVLDRSQLQRLQSYGSADPRSPAAQRVRRSFETILQAVGPEQPVDLRVVTGDVVAETVQGRVIIANQGLGELGEGARLFILAHEFGHVSLKHWPQMTLLYQAWLPGELMQSNTDAVAALLGRDASELAHKQEFEADCFALRTLHALGRSREDALSAFTEMGVFSDTATHPGTRKRLAALRAADHALADHGQD